MPDLELSRRQALAGLTALAVGFDGKGLRAMAGTTAETDPMLAGWIRVHGDGQVSVLVNCCEMGQGTQTAYAQIVADELGVPWERMVVEQAPIAPAYYNDWGIYSTGGSGLTRQHFSKLRKAAAAAREMLIRAAAQEWSVDPARCRIEDGAVCDGPTGRRRPIGTLAALAARLPVPQDPVLKSAAERRLIGKPVPRLDLDDIVRGRSGYGIDVVLPGLRYAAIRQAPRPGAALLNVEQGPALAVRGVSHVVTIVGGRVGAVTPGASGRSTGSPAQLPDALCVVADGWWAASKGLESLAPEWSAGPHADLDSRGMADEVRRAALDAQSVSHPRSDAATAANRVEEMFAAAHRTLSADYSVPLLTQAPLEPMNATARVSSDAAELWLPTQSQSGARDAVASALGLPAASVVVHTTRMGGGFGRRLETDYAVQAALIARAVGAPVKLLWSRQEDMRQGFYRPPAFARFEAALDARRRPIAVRVRTGASEEDTRAGLGANPYRFGPACVYEQPCRLGLRMGSWRSVDLSYGIFFLESFVDELAEAAGEDPLAFRLALLDERPRVARALRAVADCARWGAAAPGRAQGVALVSAWGTVCAQVAEVSVTDNRLVIHRICCAIDPGTIVNPDLVTAQVEGGILYGLGAALAQEITVAGGRVEQSSFRDYPTIRLADTPQNIDVVLLESPDVPIGGVGEPPVPPIAPALCNAIAAATGRRIRSLPVSKAGFAMSIGS